MLSSDRRRYLVLIAASLTLAACGFAPVYAPGGAALALRGRLRIAPIDGLLGFAMRERLTSRLGATDAPTHMLKVALEIDSEGLAITPQASITRFNLTGTAKYAVRLIGKDEALFEDSVQSFAAYNTTASPFATRVAERDTRIRLVRVLADMIAARLAATADRWLL